MTTTMKQEETFDTLFEEYRHLEHKTRDWYKGKLTALHERMVKKKKLENADIRYREPRDYYNFYTLEIVPTIIHMGGQSYYTECHLDRVQAPQLVPISKCPYPPNEFRSICRINGTYNIVKKK